MATHLKKTEPMLILHFIYEFIICPRMYLQHNAIIRKAMQNVETAKLLNVSLMLFCGFMQKGGSHTHEPQHALNGPRLPHQQHHMYLLLLAPADRSSLNW